MAMRDQIRDTSNGDARWLEVDGATHALSIKDPTGAATLATLSGQIVWPLGGQFLLDPGEVNGWGTVGPVDDSNTQDLGNVGAANLNRNSGGLVFPFDVNLARFFAWHRNSNADAEAWGFVLHHQAKTGGSNTVTTTYILDEVTANGGVGPRNYGNNQNQQTDLDLTAVTAAQGIPAGNVIGLAVAAPTAVATNRFVQIQGGYLLFERAG